ncbi:MAG: acyl-CoA dehydrogenase family protein, partial [Terriglobales bacterium]
LSDDGRSYRLHGEKLWISNAGFADLFTVFAKLEGKVSAFLVEASTAGLSTGPEEHKMGIAGSSTRALILRDAVVPRENLLGECGDGAHIAFQILNVGRIKLGAACIGGARNLLRQTMAYAQQRHAFGRPIASYGLVEQYVATMAVELFAAESAVYRTTGLMDSAPGLDEYAVECSIVKILASEMMDCVADLAVQIHGGNGYVRGNPAERAYRDARVNRIFEGTNEINRLLASGVLLKRAQQGRLGLLAGMQRIEQGLLAPAPSPAPDALERGRQLTLLVAAAAVRRHGEALAQEQELLAGICDLTIAVYTMQSAWLRQPGGALAQVILSGRLDAM